MTTEKFIKRILLKIIIFAIIITAVITFTNASSAIINNYIALGQLENNDGMYILMEMYNNFLKPTIKVITFAVSIFITYGIGTDIYKFIKIRKKETN